jgi:hypothetical protein
MVLPPPDTEAAPGLPALDDDAWDDLLNYIEERRVIPIVGPELLRVETDAGPRLLYDWLAEKLAGKLNVDLRQLPQPCTLNDVVCWYLAARGRREEAYTRLRSILRETNFAVPPALRQLAQITDFDLLITTTFDPLLEQALNAERFGGAATTERSSPIRPTVSPTSPLSATSSSARWSTTCSVVCRRRRRTSFPMRTRWSSSARCRASTSRRRSSSTSWSTTTCC